MDVTLRQIVGDRDVATELQDVNTMLIRHYKASEWFSALRRLLVLVMWYPEEVEQLPTIFQLCNLLVASLVDERYPFTLRALCNAVVTRLLRSEPQLLQKDLKYASDDPATLELLFSMMLRVGTSESWTPNMGNLVDWLSIPLCVPWIASSSSSNLSSLCGGIGQGTLASTSAALYALAVTGLVKVLVCSSDMFAPSMPDLVRRVEERMALLLLLGSDGRPLPVFAPSQFAAIPAALFAHVFGQTNAAAPASASSTGADRATASGASTSSSSGAAVSSPARLLSGLLGSSSASLTAGAIVEPDGSTWTTSTTTMPAAPGGLFSVPVPFFTVLNTVPASSSASALTPAMAFGYRAEHLCHVHTVSVLGTWLWSSAKWSRTAALSHSPLLLDCVMLYVQRVTDQRCKGDAFEEIVSIECVRWLIAICRLDAARCSRAASLVKRLMDRAPRTIALQLAVLQFYVEFGEAVLFETAPYVATCLDDILVEMHRLTSRSAFEVFDFLLRHASVFRARFPWVLSLYGPSMLRLAALWPTLEEMAVRWLMELLHTCWLDAGAMVELLHTLVDFPFASSMMERKHSATSSFGSSSSSAATPGRSRASAPADAGFSSSQPVPILSSSGSARNLALSMPLASSLLSPSSDARPAPGPGSAPGGADVDAFVQAAASSRDLASWVLRRPVLPQLSSMSKSGASNASPSAGLLSATSVAVRCPLYWSEGASCPWPAAMADYVRTHGSSISARVEAACRVACSLVQHVTRWLSTHAPLARQRWKRGAESAAPVSGGLSSGSSASPPSGSLPSSLVRGSSVGDLGPEGGAVDGLSSARSRAATSRLRGHAPFFVPADATPQDASGTIQALAGAILLRSDALCGLNACDGPCLDALCDLWSGLIAVDPSPLLVFQPMLVRALDDIVPLKPPMLEAVMYTLGEYGSVAWASALSSSGTGSRRGGGDGVSAERGGGDPEEEKTDNDGALEVVEALESFVYKWLAVAKDQQLSSAASAPADRSAMRPTAPAGTPYSGPRSVPNTPSHVPTPGAAGAPTAWSTPASRAGLARSPSFASSSGSASRDARVLELALLALAKFAATDLSYVARVALCVSKVVDQAPALSETLVQFAQELLRLLMAPSVAAIVLAPRSSLCAESPLTLSEVDRHTSLPHLLLAAGTPIEVSHQLHEFEGF